MKRVVTNKKPVAVFHMYSLVKRRFWICISDFLFAWNKFCLFNQQQITPNMKRDKLLGMLLLVIVCIAGPGCKDDPDNTGSGSGTMEVRLTDDVGFYEKVYINIQGIQVNIQGHGWVDITPARRGIYNMLDFNNGADTLIAFSAVPAGEVTEVRLILGDNNSVVVDGITWPMATPSASSSGLKMKFHQTVSAGEKVTLWIDFNVHKSIVAEGNGYSLRPVLRCFVRHFTGSIVGDVNPDNSAFFAYAVPMNDVNDTFMTFLRSDGTFKLWGLLPRTYSVGFKTKEKVVVKTLSNIVVSAGQEKNVGVVNIP